MTTTDTTYVTTNPAAARDRKAAMNWRTYAGTTSLSTLGVYLSMTVIFLWFGAMKFTDVEAAGIAGLVLNSPIMSWTYGAFGISGTSTIIGVIEIATGLLLACRLFSPRIGMIGAVMSTITFLITFSFFFTTPIVPEPLAGGFPAISILPGQFLLKDLALLALSVHLVMEARQTIAARKA